MKNVEMYNLEMALHCKRVKVKQYRYRTAMLNHYIVTIPRDDELEALLAKAAETSADNHTVYELTFEDGASVAIMCSDGKMHFGLGVKESRW